MFGNSDITKRTIEDVKKHNGKIKAFFQGEDIKFIIELEDEKTKQKSIL